MLGGVARGVVLLLGVLEVFEKVGVEDGRGDFVVAGGPLAEVDGATALGAEGDFGGVEGGEFFADGAVEGFGHGDHAWLILQGPKALQMSLLPGGPGRWRDANFWGVWSQCRVNAK